MLRRGGIRLGGVVALLLLLSTPLAAEPRGPGLGGWDLANVWSWVTSWFAGPESPWKATTEAACDAGLSPDPNGCPHGPALKPDPGRKTDPVRRIQ